MVSSPVIAPISTINTRPLHWLWPGHIPFSHLTILYGQPGTGLSLTALQFAASVSSGRTLPDGLSCPQGNVILVSPFDSPEHTIKPRLENAAADTSRIFLLNTVPNSDSSPSTTERPFSLAHDFDLLENTIQQTSARLVIIDSPDLTRDQLMRSLLPRLTHLAHRTATAILLVRPLTKSLSVPIRPASLQTLPLISSVHSALLFIPDPEEDQERILLTIKHSLSTPTPPLSCTISPQPSGIPTIQWLGEYIGSVISSPDAEEIQNKRSELRQDILKFLSIFPEPLNAQDLTELIPFTYDNIRKTLQRMTQSGDIISPARGLYTVTPSTRAIYESNVPSVPTDPITFTPVDIGMSSMPANLPANNSYPGSPLYPFSDTSVPTVPNTGSSSSLVGKEWYTEGSLPPFAGQTWESKKEESNERKTY